MSDPIQKLIPTLAAGVQFILRSDGTALVVAPDRGTWVELSAEEAALVALVDDQRSVADIIAEHFRQHDFVPFQALTDALAKLVNHNLLAGSRQDWEAAGFPHHHPPFWRSRARVLKRVELPSAWHWVGIIPAAFLLSVAALGAGHLQSTPSVLMPRGEPALGLGLMLAGILGGLLTRAFLQAWVAALFGARPLNLEVRVRVFPVLEASEWIMYTLPRNARIAFHSAALAGPWLLALAAYAFGTEAAAFALGAGLVGFVDACPFAPTSMGRALAAWAGRVDLRDHARSYLSKRFLSQLGGARRFAGEDVIVVTSVLSAAWAFGALDIQGILMPRQVSELFLALPRLSRPDFASAIVLIVFILSASGMALFLSIRIALQALGSALPRRLGAGSRAQGLHLHGALDRIARIPLFARLDTRQRQELADEALAVRFTPGEFIIRQGERGEHFYALEDGQVDVLQEAPSGLERALARLGPGDCFGEQALLTSAPRSASVRARTAVSAFRLSRPAFESFIARNEKTSLVHWVRACAAIQANPFFRAFPAERIGALLTSVAAREVPAGTFVIRSGEIGHELFLVQEGQLEVLDSVQERRIGLLGPGDHFGEVALLRSVPRVASVRALTEVKLLVLSKESFHALLASDLAASQALEERARKRVRSLA